MSQEYVKWGDSQIAQGLKASAAKPDNLSVIHRPQIENGENRLMKVVLSLACVV